jgi:hypothetical protein
MDKFKVFLSLLIIGVGIFITMALPAPAAARKPAQQPGGTAGGVVATVKMDDNPDINVRSGPGVDFDLVGKLLAGQQVPALGRSPGGDWVQIVFPGGAGGVAWVYAFLVDLSGAVPVVELPPTPTPRVTPTFDPVLAAQFVVEASPTRLPTFTPPPPLVIPTFTEDQQPERTDNVSFVYAILGLGLIGLLGTLMSFIRVR